MNDLGRNVISMEDKRKERERKKAAQNDEIFWSILAENGIYIAYDERNKIDEKLVIDLDRFK